MNLFDLVFRPHLEEASDKAEVCEAANLLQIGEFQFLQLAYYEWYGRDMPEQLYGRVFQNHMVCGAVPFWARHYARQVLEMERAGRLNDQHPHFHRYDSGFAQQHPKPVWEFWATSLLFLVVLAGSIMIANMSVRDPVSLLPPYFERSSLPGNAE